MSGPVMAPRKRPEAVLEMRLDSAAVGSGNGMVTTLVIKHKALKEGEHVLARCDGNLFAWNAAKITKDNGDGTYDLKYTSGGCLGLQRETERTVCIRMRVRPTTRKTNRMTSRSNVWVPSTNWY